MAHGVAGVAFLYVSPALRERLSVRWHGWKAVADMWDFLNYDQPLAARQQPLRRRNAEFLGVLSLGHSIEVLQTPGGDAIARTSSR